MYSRRLGGGEERFHHQDSACKHWAEPGLFSFLAAAVFYVHSRLPDLCTQPHCPAHHTPMAVFWCTSPSPHRDCFLVQGSFLVETGVFLQDSPHLSEGLLSPMKPWLPSYAGPLSFSDQLFSSFSLFPFLSFPGLYAFSPLPPPALSSFFPHGVTSVTQSANLSEGPETDGLPRTTGFS